MKAVIFIWLCLLHFLAWKSEKVNNWLHSKFCMLFWYACWQLYSFRQTICFMVIHLLRENSRFYYCLQSILLVVWTIRKMIGSNDLLVISSQAIKINFELIKLCVLCFSDYSVAVAANTPPQTRSLSAQNSVSTKVSKIGAEKNKPSSSCSAKATRYVLNIYLCCACHVWSIMFIHLPYWKKIFIGI